MTIDPPDAFEEVSTVLSTKFDPSPEPEASFVLLVVDGPSSGQKFVIEGSEPSRVLVGKSPSCEVRFEDPEVSRRHAALNVVGSLLKITDMGSSNGTYVDGLRIGEAYLSGNETLRIGSTTVRVERLQPSTERAISNATSFGRVAGASVEMRRLFPLCERLASSDVPVIIEGESGTGKEVLAESLHEMGPRRGGPFVVFDCTAVSANLMEAELFGHERGAFTGAMVARPGVFELAQGGTLLIDEIGDLALELQPKLLRAVERREVRRIGGRQAVRVDVRLLAATRRDLDEEVQAGRFRDDLFHRLAVARIELPPLRARRGDADRLARLFWQELGGSPAAIDPALFARWGRERWPGNVRELRNAVARQLALGDLTSEKVQDSSRHLDVMQRVLKEHLPLPRAREVVVREFERIYIEHVLTENGGDTARAAAASGIARRYFNLLRAKSQK
jgi:DNA-binding NtrC family response regulator